MKQRFLLLMTLMVAVLTFSACSSDDDDNNGNSNSSIVGTWYGENDDESDEFQFNADGTCTDITTELDMPSTKTRLSGTYTLNGSKLTFYWTKDEDWSSLLQTWTNSKRISETYTVNISVKPGKLTLSATDGSGSVTFTRK
ncbi:hypothetical protein [Hallella multisaccharivorax]|nr:hypothetical protein [Hallella multisaccharivorax]